MTVNQGYNARLLECAGRKELTLNSKIITRYLYGFTGVAFLLVGAVILSVDTGLLPEAVTRVVLNVANSDVKSLHVLQEFGAFLVFIALITFWFMRHYEQSAFFHWALTFAWALLALAHWFDVRGPFHLGIGPLINSVPFVVFALVGLLRLSSEAGTKAR